MDGGNGAENFSCGGGTDTMADFSTYQGDFKSEDYEINQVHAIVERDPFNNRQPWQIENIHQKKLGTISR